MLRLKCSKYLAQEIPFGYKILCYQFKDDLDQEQSGSKTKVVIEVLWIQSRGKNTVVKSIVTRRSTKWSSQFRSHALYLLVEGTFDLEAQAFIILNYNVLPGGHFLRKAVGVHS